jgi:small subunit ribosomal protein S20
MANHKSAEKRIRRNSRRRTINGVWRARLRTCVKAVELAIATGDPEAAKVAFTATEPQLARGAQRGTVHRNAMRRKLSRLSVRIRAM